MQVKDFQFVKYVMRHEAQLPENKVAEPLLRRVDIQTTGEPDSITVRNNSLTLHNPTTVTKSLFNILYHSLSDFALSGYHKDKLALVLIEICRRYVYRDFQRPEAMDKPPVMISYDKISVPSIIIHELLEPIVGRIKLPKVFFIDCPFTDACRRIDRAEQIYRFYKIERQQVDFQSTYPIILTNSSLYNDAAKQTHLIYLTLEMEFGDKAAGTILKRILLDNPKVYNRITSVLKLLNGGLRYATDFVKFLRCHAELDLAETEKSLGIEAKALQADGHFAKLIKEGQDAYYTPQVFRQWNEWSVLMGLIENQLAPMRGSIWPASENLGPIEDAKRARMVEKAKNLGKRPSELTFQELLEVSRDWYDHNAIEPGKLYEELLKAQRVWKV